MAFKPWYNRYNNLWLYSKMESIDMGIKRNERNELNDTDTKDLDKFK